MQSSLIGKIEKAKRYAEEPDRVTFTEFTISFRGEHDNYLLRYKDNKWHCSCNFFAGWGTCSHVMAVQKLLASMLPREASTATTQNT